MAELGIMLEGQNGLNWARWQRILQVAEDFGYKFVFRSDHYTNPNPPDYDSLELFVSLTYAASHTSRIEFGSMVAPVTFRHPTMTVRMAAQIDDLSNGRLVLGLGAGWQEREHHNFGVPFYDFPTRFAMLEEALEITTRLLRSDEPVSYQGKHFSLDGAILLPRPKRRTPILIGGKGPKRTMPLVAKYADEWNMTFVPPARIKELNSEMDALLAKNGRKPGDVKRSIMTGGVFAKDAAELDAKLNRIYRITSEQALERGVIHGTPSMWIDQIGRAAEAGMQRFMLQWLDLDDIESLEIIARDVLPHFHK